MIFATFAAALLAAASLSVDAEKHSVKFSATATGIVPNATVEFLLVDPDSDRDYESVFVTEASVSEIATALEKAGIPLGRPVGERACRFWPAGPRVTISPDPWQYVTDKELETDHLPAIFTGGVRDASGSPLADSVMPKAVFAFYGLDQSLILLDDALDQSVTYGRFAAKRELEKGTRVEFTVSWDGTTRVPPYRLSLKPGNLKESLEAMRSAAGECGLDVATSFSPEMTVAEATTAANALAILDSRQVRINGFDEGQFFYRAFLPLEKWRDRKERLTQPLEVVLSGTNETFTVIDEDWNVEGLDPLLTPRTVSFDEACKVNTDTCFVFLPPDTKLERLYILRKSLPPSLRNWYFYAD